MGRRCATSCCREPPPSWRALFPTASLRSRSSTDFHAAALSNVTGKHCALRVLLADHPDVDAERWLGFAV